MSMLGIFWIVSVIVSYGVGMYLGIYLSKPKDKKKKWVEKEMESNG